MNRYQAKADDCLFKTYPVGEHCPYQIRIDGKGFVRADEAQIRIVTALLDAENQAYEKAAELIESYQAIKEEDKNSKNQQVHWALDIPQQIAGRVRALKGAE